MNSKINWVVAIVIQQDGDHFFEYSDLLLSILNQPGFDNIKYKIFYYDQPSGMVSIKELQVGTDGSPVPLFKFVERPFKTNIYNSRALTEFFSKSFQEKKDVENRFMAILWAHGAGLGYVGVDPKESLVPNYLDDITPKSGGRAQYHKVQDYNELMKHMLYFKAQLSAKGKPMEIVHKVFKEEGMRISPSESQSLAERLRLITAVQMNTIFKNALPRRRKIDVLITNTCYTQTLESGYALKDTVSILISPQTTIPFAGFNYTALFRQMEANPGLTAGEIAANVKRNFNKKYDDPHFKKQLNCLTPGVSRLLNEVSFSANDLSYYEELVGDFFAGMAQRFWKAADPDNQNEQNEQLVHIIRRARKKCGDISPSFPFDTHQYGIIDLTHFVNNFEFLCNEEGIEGWDDLFEKYRAVTKKIRLAWHKAAGPGEYSEHGASRSPHYLSFFFPSEVDSEMTDALLKIYKQKFGNHGLPKNFAKWPAFIFRWRNI